MTSLVYVLVGVAVTLQFADAALTLDGIRRSGGRIKELNPLMRWFARSAWRVWLVVPVVAFLTYVVANVLTVWAGWPWGVAFCVPLIVQRGIVVVHNYRLNVKVM
jgi:hypothetical protein